MAGRSHEGERNTDRSSGPVRLGSAMAAEEVVARSVADDISVGREVRGFGAARPAAAPGGGQPLDEASRAFFERRFGADLGSVRVHDGGDSARVASRLSASAFTVGEHIAFAAGAYAPDTSNGRRLLAHELTHVLQAREASGPNVLRRECDPSVATCPEEPACVNEPDDIIPEPTQDSCPADFSLDVAVSGPPPLGSTATSGLEHLRLANPVLWSRQEDYYLVPINEVFATPEEATQARCQGPPWASNPDASGPLAPFEPAGPLGPQGPVGPVAPSIFAGPIYLPGDTVYALDGPLTVTAATADYIVTNVYTKFAVGAGSMTLVLTANGYVLVDAGMHQVGGNINDTLADAAIERLADALGGEPLTEVMLTHLHADHTALLPRVYARWEIGTLRLNALQALLPSRSGTGTQLDDIARSMIAARRDRIATQVRADLTSSFGPWDLIVDPAEREAQLAAAVGIETNRRMAAMRPTNVELALPSGGQVVAASMPLGSVALPAGFAFDTAPITRAMGANGIVTILDPRASTITAAAAGGTPPVGAMVDTQSSSYVIDLPSGAQLIVVSDQRVEDLLALQTAFQDQLARFGTPRQFRIWDMTHHLQVGFSRGTGIVRGQQLAALTQMLSDFIDARNQGGPVIGDALIVSVHGPGTGTDSYIDPANIWLLRSLGIEVLPATGGSSVLTAAQDMSVLEVELSPNQRVSGIAGPSYPGLSSSDFLLRRAAAAMALIDERVATERAALASAADDAERATVQGRIDGLTAERSGIQRATEAYATAFQTELSRSTRGAGTARPDVNPPVGGSEPAVAEANALRALLVDYTAPVVGVVPRFSPAALVVLGQESRITLDANTRALIDARTRVVELAAGLRWTSPPERRAEVASALDAYRSRLLAAMSTQPGTREVLQRELARIDADMTALTGLSAQAWQEMREAAELAAQVERNRLQARELASTDELINNATALDIIANNNGYALAGGTLYQLTRTGEQITFATVPLAPAQLPRSAGAAGPSAPPQIPAALAAGDPRGGAGMLALAPQSRGLAPYGPQLGPVFIPQPLPPELAAWPNIINVSGRTIVFEGGASIPPTPSVPIGAMRPGELFVRGGTSGWLVCDPRSGLPIAGAARGGEVWQVQVGGGYTLLVDVYGNVQQEGRPRVVARSMAEATYGGRVGTPEPPLPRGPTGGQRVVAGGLGIIMVANEILGPIGQVLQIQRQNIARRRGQLRFWTEYGANPVHEMRTQNSDQIQPAGAAADTAILGDPVYDTVSAIDPEALGRTLATRIRNYQDFLLWTDLGVSLGCIEINPPRTRNQSVESRALPRTYKGWVAGDPGTREWVYYDLTPVLRPIEERTLADLDREMRQEVAGWSDEARGRIYRLRHGSATRTSRLHDSGWIHGDEPIASSSAIFGPDPWVYVRERRGGRALCEAANADARRSALVSAYSIHKSIEDTMEEVRDGGRQIISRHPESGRLESFVAGPSSDGRLGEVRYYRDPNPDTSRIWTVAIGQLNWFWVSNDDLEPVAADTIAEYVRPRAP